MDMKVSIYTDGAARGNPDGPGGYGTIISFTDANGREHIRSILQATKKLIIEWNLWQP